MLSSLRLEHFALALAVLFAAGLLYPPLLFVGMSLCLVAALVVMPRDKKGVSVALVIAGYVFGLAWGFSFPLIHSVVPVAHSSYGGFTLEYDGDIRTRVIIVNASSNTEGCSASCLGLPATLWPGGKLECTVKCSSSVKAPIIEVTYIPCIGIQCYGESGLIFHARGG